MSLRGLICGLLALVGVAWAVPASAQEQPQDEGDVLEAGGGLMTSRELRARKRKEARRGDWALTAVVGETVGFDSNIFRSPEDLDGETGLVHGSAFTEVAAEAQLRRYFSRRHRLKAQAEAYLRLFSETGRIQDVGQALDLAYELRFTRDLDLTIALEGDHRNDNAVDVRGQRFSRDFEYLAFGGGAMLHYGPGKAHDVEIGYEAARKDYDETPGKESMDWLAHGPAFRYRFRPTDDLAIRLWYGLDFQGYDEETANDRDSVERPGNPAERHFLHYGLLWTSYEVFDGFELQGKYRFRAKDDRHQGYESYLSHGVDLGLDWRFVQSTAAEVLLALELRDYAHRRGADSGGSLSYRKYQAGVRLSHNFTEAVTVLLVYSFALRDTNRDSGNSYRDYSVHGASAALSVAF